MPQLMNVTKLLEKLLALSTENEWVEFKVSNANPEEIGENIEIIRQLNPPEKTWEISS